ncbi:MAG: tetratricopeptide repeat protein [Terriglobales bacterium]
MKRSHISMVAGTLLVLCLVGSVLALRQVDRVRGHATLEEVLYVSSPKALKRLSLGYSGLLADIYWTRAVQYFGSKQVQGADEYKLLGPLLEITTTLDPKLLVAYEYGSNFLTAKPPQGAGMPDQAIALVKQGIKNNPDEWHLYYDLGFIYYLELKDYRDAADAFARGSRLPNAHPWLKVMAARAAQEGGEAQMARMLWTTTFETTPNKDVKANAAAHLRALKVDADVTSLEALQSQFKEKTGHFASSFAELAAAGMLRGVPVDPLGVPYKLVAEGKVEVQDPDDLPFIQKGLSIGYIPPRKIKLLPVD